MLVLLTSFRSRFENLSTNGSLSMLSMQFPFALSSVEGQMRVSQRLFSFTNFLGRGDHVW
jgi:hypothetical protein